MKSKIFILIGPPGAGKGTQAKNIAVTKDFVLISTGDLLRENVEKKTELGQIAKSYMDKGEFVPIELVAKIIKTNIQQNLNKNGFIEFNLEVDKVIYIDVKDEAIIDRLTNRRVCPKCKRVYHMKYNKPKNDETCDDCGVKLITRDDDKPEVIKNRLETYHKVTHPLVEHFEKIGKVIRINGEKSPKDVENDILSLI